MKSHAARLGLLGLTVLALTFLFSCAAAETKVTVKAHSKVYDGLTSSARAATVAADTRASLTGLSKGWARVRRGKVTAYLPAKNLRVNDVFKAYATGTTALYRSASSSSRLASLSKGTALAVGGISGSYAHVMTRDGTKGWVKLASLSTSAPAASGTSAKAESKVDRLLRVAMAKLGKSSSRMDCSKFTAYCYGKVGIKISRGAKYQGYMTKYPRVTSTGALKAGDLVVFNTVSTDKDLSDHTGIYLGKGKFIHYSTTAGKVIIRSLKTGYYARKFSWGLRIIA